MLIVRTDWKSFDDYVKRLSESAQKNYRYVEKHNKDLIYEETGFNREELERFMGLWERQLIRGEYKQWAFPSSHIENLHNQGRIRFFRARVGDNVLALHFVQKHNGMWECHPPMYEKSDENQRRYLAKFMWFSLIRYAIESRWNPLDLGGGPDNWREHIKNRKNYPNPAYKWVYVPEETKKNPDKENNWSLKIINGERIYENI
jgi:hypothetical protein